MNPGTDCQDIQYRRPPNRPSRLVPNTCHLKIETISALQQVKVHLVNYRLMKSLVSTAGW
jgi:hypothetical protein